MLMKITMCLDEKCFNSEFYKTTISPAAEMSRILKYLALQFLKLLRSLSIVEVLGKIDDVNFDMLTLICCFQ